MRIFEKKLTDKDEQEWRDFLRHIHKLGYEGPFDFLRAIQHGEYHHPRTFHYIYKGWGLNAHGLTVVEHYDSNGNILHIAIYRDGKFVSDSMKWFDETFTGGPAIAQDSNGKEKS